MNNSKKIDSRELTTNETVSWQTLQEFYHRIVGKKESLRKRFTEPYQYKLADIEDLHQRLLHIAKTYHLIL